MTTKQCLIQYIFILLRSCLRYTMSLSIISGRVGCPHYMAPEVITRRQYGKACDVWGAGVMLHVLLSGRLPFHGSGRRLQESIARGRVTVSSKNIRRKNSLNFHFFFFIKSSRNFDWYFFFLNDF